MRITFLFIATIIFLIFAEPINAQNSKINYQSLTKADFAEHPYWIEMMNDNSVNFYDVQKAFNVYFENRDQGKGSGWKQFKRWEHFMEERVYPTGERLNTVQAWDEMMEFKKKYPTKNTRENNTWMPMGPTTSQNITGHWNPGLGRINVIALDPNDTNTIYIGAPSGGLWKSVNEGMDWEVLTDDLPVLGVSAIAIDYTDTDVIYIGTGDKDANDTYSIGILKSTDGGNTWDVSGLDWEIGDGRTIAKLLIHPDDHETLFAASTSGLYKTTDAGESWDMILSGDIDDIEFKPGDADVIYAVTKDFFRSTDGGETFEEIDDVPNQYRVQIAVTDANPDYVYFFSSRDGIYRSEDSGLTFERKSDAPNQMRQDWYDLALTASHINAEEVHLGEINTFRSTDGASSWTQTTEWYWPNDIGYTHCDIHEMVFFGGTLYVGSDGLVSKSTNSGDSWLNLSEGICIRQFYRIGGSQNAPNKLMGGSQDNGTSVYTDDEWHEWLGADGMECLVDYTNDEVVYGTSQGGTFYKSNTGGYNGGVTISQPGGGAWVTPFVIHPTENETLFVGLSEIRKTTDGMQSWSTISSFGSGNLRSLAIAASNADYLFASTGSTIYRTTDGGENWENISSGLPNLSITYIAIHPENEDKIAVSLSGYQEGNKVYISDDAGDTWVNHSANLPNLPANCVSFNKGAIDGLYVGMDVGAYYRDLTLEEWEPFMEGLPNVMVYEFELNFEAGLIRAGTYGRGLWETELHPSIPPDIEMSYTLKSGEDDKVEYGETATLDIKLKNNMTEMAENVTMNIDNNSPYISLLDSLESFGDILPGDSILIVDAFSFEASTFIPNEYPVELFTTITYDSVLYDKIKFKGYAPIVAAGNTVVNDGDNGQIDPGDDAAVDLTIANTGGASATNIEVILSTTDTYTTLENTTANFIEMLPEQSDLMGFNISVSEDAPIGHIILIAVDISADKDYVRNDTIAFTVGIIVEGFETGDFSKYPWEGAGDNEWTIDDMVVYEGSYSARSGEINNNQESVLTLEMEVLGNGEISFYKKVSCEDDPGGTGYDYLSFSIDGEEQGRWDGEIDWSEETFDVEAGLRTFEWKFYKDQYVSEGDDATWIDYIVLPPVDVPVGLEESAVTTQENRVKVYPNPTSGNTAIGFELDKKTDVSLDIFNASGQIVKTLVNNRTTEKGQHIIKWYGKDNAGKKVPDGLYFYRLITDEQHAGRIIIMK